MNTFSIVAAGLGAMCTLSLAACGGGAAPAVSSAAAASAQAPSAAASASTKPAASAAASTKPAASAGASTKPAASGAGPASAKPAASGSASAAAKPAASGGAQTKIIASYSEVSAANLQSWIAKDGGYFEKNGLDVDLRLIESTTGVPAVISGEVQVGQFGGSEALAAAVGGANLTVTATLSPVLPYTFLAAPDIKTRQDLTGKKVGVSKIGSSSDTALRAGFAKLGIVPDKDVSVISVGSRAAQTAAAQSGAVQGELSHPPDSIELEKIGWHQLFDFTSLGLVSANTTVAASNTWLGAHKDVMQKYIDSEVQAEARAKKDKPFAESILKKYMKIEDQQALDETYDFYVNHVLAVLPTPSADQFRDAVDQLSDKNPKVKTFNVSSIVDPSFVKSAADRGLDK
jgi:NitT/TauT family transport system substrate-binding protein